MAQSTRDTTKNWEDEAARMQQTAHELIRQHPILTLTMAVATGYLAGRVFSRI